MTENNLQLQIKIQERIKIILFIVRIILFIHVIGGLFLSIFLLIISRFSGNLLLFAIIIFIVTFLFEQWGTSYRILSFSSAQFMRKNKILLFTYNIFTLNILGIILASKFLKNDNYNCINLLENKDFGNENKGSYNNKTLYHNKITYHINEAIYYRRKMSIFLGILTVIFAVKVIWSHKYMKYLDTHKHELINVQAYNRMLFDIDFLIYIFGKRKKAY